MPLTPAERMARTRARRRGEVAPQPTCSVCGKPIKDSGNGRAFASGLCHRHWLESDAGKAFVADQRRLRREAKTGPKPFRYFGAPPGEEAWPEGPFNRLRLAVSSSYIGKGKPRGKVWIVWSDDVVTEHEGVTQAHVGVITRDDGIAVDRSDLAAQARQVDALTERVRHYGHADIYLV